MKTTLPAQPERAIRLTSANGLVIIATARAGAITRRNVVRRWTSEGSFSLDIKRGSIAHDSINILRKSFGTLSAAYLQQTLCAVSAADLTEPLTAALRRMRIEVQADVAALDAATLPVE